MPEGLSRTKQSKNSEHARSYLDAISYGQDQDTEASQNNQMLERVSKMTSDPILSEMLLDTAQTTLPAQMSADHSRGTATPPVDKAARIVQGSTPEDIFGEAESSKWATLAFGS